MKSRVVVLFCLVGLSLPAFGSALGTAARSVIPKDVQQIITVDYRKMADSPSAMALKERVLPDNLKEFEKALRGFGINPDRDVEQLVFASFRGQKSGLRVVGIAQGQFPMKRFLTRLRVRKVRPEALRDARLYPMGNGMVVTFLDDWTMLFGHKQSVQDALDARDGLAESLNANSRFTDMMPAVHDAAVWSVLDQQGTQHMVRSALGEAAALADYEMVKKRLVASRYVIEFNRGVDFNLDVLTSDSFTAATLSSLLKAGMMYKRMRATDVEKAALENVSVDSDSDTLKVRFEVDDKRFQSLLDSDLFAAVSR